MKILVLNGPNMNLLGVRTPEIYGTETYGELCKKIKAHAKSKGAKVKFYQSNHEGKLIDKIHSSLGKFDGIVFNPAAYTHTSIALADAIEAVNIPCIEVHISDINSREEFRKISFVSRVCAKTISGKGTLGYLDAIDELIKLKE